MKIIERLSASAQAVALISRNICLASMIIVIILLFTESVTRKILNTSIIVVDEVGGAGMLLFIMFGLSWLYQEGSHLRATFLVDRLSQRPRAILELFLAIFSLSFVCFAGYNWWRMLRMTYDCSRLLPMLRIREWPFQAATVVAWGLLAFVVLADIMTQAEALSGKVSYIKIHEEHLEVKG